MERPAAGKKIRSLSASSWTDMEAAAAAFRAGRLGMDGDVGGFAYPNPPTIKVRNDTGADLPRFAVVAVGDSWVDPSSSSSALDIFKTGPTCKGTEPATGGEGKFAILLDACLKDGVVDACVSGVTICKLVVGTGEEDYEWADITDGSTETLTVNASRGSARILSKESGVGTKWGIVRLSNRASQLPTCFFYNVRTYRPTDGYRSGNDIAYNRSPGSLYWVNSIGDVAGCNLTVNTASVTAYTDWSLKVGVAGYYEIEFQCTAYDNTADVDKSYYEATTDAGGAQGDHTHGISLSPVTSSSGTPDTHTHGGAVAADGSHTHTTTISGASTDADGSFSNHTHTVRVPQGRDGISSSMHVLWRAAGGAEGDWELAACAWAQFRDFPCLNQTYLGNYASAAPRAILYLPANAELVFRVGCSAPSASASQYDDAHCAITNYQAFTNCTIKFHGASLPTASHYP